MIKTDRKDLEVIQTYEEYIKESREKFEKSMTEGQELNIQTAMEYTDELSMRLEYYKEIKKYRKQLKKQATVTFDTPREQLFEITLKVRHPNEVKEFNFSDRNSTEVSMILQRIREDLA